MMLVGLADLVSTVALYSAGLVVELNPLMRPLLDRSPALFALVKLATLAAVFVALQWHRPKDERFVRKAAAYGTAAYVTLWAVWVGLAALLG